MPCTIALAAGYLVALPAWADQAPATEASSDAASSSSSAPGSQQPAAPALYEVQTPGGARYCGQLVNQRPGEYVVLKRSSGEMRILQWEADDAKHLQAVATCPSPPAPLPGAVASEPTSVSAPISDPTQPAPPALSVSSSAVLVQFHSNYPVTLSPLRVEDAAAGSYGPLQDGLVRLEPQIRYKVAGVGIPSAKFLLGESGYTYVSVEAGSRAKQGVGVAFLALGGFGLVTGFVFGFEALILAAVRADAAQPGVICAASLGAGLPMLGLGLWLVISGPTRVRLSAERQTAAILLTPRLRLSASGLAF